MKTTGLGTVLGLACCLTLHAAEPPEATALVVQIEGHGNRGSITLEEGTSLADAGHVTLFLAKGAQVKEHNGRIPYAFRFTGRRQGAVGTVVVLAIVSRLPGDCIVLGPGAPKDVGPRDLIPVGVYQVRQGAQFDIAEMSEYGLQPFKISVAK